VEKAKDLYLDNKEDEYDELVVDAEYDDPRRCNTGYRLFEHIDGECECGANMYNSVIHTRMEWRFCNQLDGCRFCGASSDGCPECDEFQRRFKELYEMDQEMEAIYLEHEKEGFAACHAHAEMRAEQENLEKEKELEREREEAAKRTKDQVDWEKDQLTWEEQRVRETAEELQCRACAASPLECSCVRLCSRCHKAKEAYEQGTDNAKAAAKRMQRCSCTREAEDHAHVQQMIDIGELCFCNICQRSDDMTYPVYQFSDYEYEDCDTENEDYDYGRYETDAHYGYSDNEEE
jgi:hypothetical protein